MPLEVNGIQAWITVENKVQVQEYVPEVDEATGVATCWIAAEAGQVRYYETINVQSRMRSHPHIHLFSVRGSSILLLPPSLPPFFLTCRSDQHWI